MHLTTCSQYLKGCYLYMWQSHVEIEGYSVMYFDCIAVPYRWISVKGGAHMCFEYLIIYEVHMSPALNGSLAIQTQRCEWNTRQINLWFLHGTATHVVSKCWWQAHVVGGGGGLMMIQMGLEMRLGYHWTVTPVQVTLISHLLSLRTQNWSTSDRWNSRANLKHTPC